jgi:protein tyrosine phosphatase (PTP) superfamily phosphohydrolase (DUF442 family)
MKHSKTLMLIPLILATAPALAGPPPGNTSKMDGRAPSPRPAKWAQPQQVNGLPNLHKVSGNLYRSAQPTAEGFKNLGALGIKTVVNLRSFHSDADFLRGTAVNDEHIAMKAWHPEEEDVVRFLRIMTDPKRGPVLVHCQQGADRTGTMCAIYRIAVEGWSKDEALREMRDGGFGFHGVWQDLVQFVDGLDIERIRQKAGIKRPAGSQGRPAGSH